MKAHTEIKYAANVFEKMGQRMWLADMPEVLRISATRNIPHIPRQPIHYPISKVRVISRKPDAVQYTEVIWPIRNSEEVSKSMDLFLCELIRLTTIINVGLPFEEHDLLIML